MKTKIVFTLLFFFSCSVFFLHAKSVGSAVWGDGAYYYSYVRSLVVDGDLDFRNEITHFGRGIEMTPRGFAANKYPFGSSLFWLIPFSFIHFLYHGDGYDFIYQYTTGVTSIWFGIAGLYLCFKIIRNYFSEWVSLLSVVGLYFSSNLFFYIALDPVNSHSVSFFTSSLLLYLFIKHVVNVKRIENKTILSLLLGVVSGLLILIRNQDVIFIVPMIVFLSIAKRWNEIALYLLSLFMTLIPQFVLWIFFYGQLNSPYLIRGEHFYALAPHFFDVLVSKNNGLVYTTPIILFCLFGLFVFLLLTKRNKYAGVTGISLFILQTFIIGSWQYWNGGEAYGGRMFLSLMPFLAIGISAVTDMLKKKSFSILFFLLFSFSNFINIFSFLFLH